MNKIVVVGLGSVAKRHIKNLKTLYPNATLCAVSSSGNLPVTQLAHVDLLSAEIQEAIDFNPDFAIIASPATYHFRHAKLFLDAKIPILIEKPITADSKDSYELVKLIQQAKVPVSIAYCLRYLPAIKVVKNIINKNQLGRLYNISAHVGQFLPDWRKDIDYRSSVSASIKLGGGVLLELSHELDYVQYLLGDLNYNHAILRHTQELNLEVEEIADIILTSQMGTVCSFHLNFIQKQAQRFCYFIGEKGHMYWDILNNQISITQETQKEIVFDEPSWDKNNMYLLMLEDFVAKIKANNTQLESVHSACRTIELIERIKDKAVIGEKL